MRYSAQKPVIIMQPGPSHLFWTTGVFYFWLLKEHFNFVLIVPDNYRQNQNFAKIISLESVRHVEYLPSKGGFHRHSCHNKQFEWLLRQYRPDYLLLHNRSYIENQYLIYWARKICPQAIRYHYQNGRMSLMWKSDFAARRAMQIEIILNRFSLLKRTPKLIGKLLDIRNKLVYMAHFKIFPLVNLRATFTPPVNVYNGHVNSEMVNKFCNTDKDYLLAYLDNEIEAYRLQGINNIIQVKHPVMDCGRDVFSYIYGDYAESNSILILPSYGYTSRMIEAGWKPDALVTHISNKWCEAIHVILDRYPAFDLKMKLHPVASTEPLWQGIINNICHEFPSIEIIEPNDSAEWYIVQSKVIAGDVSSALWWAGIYGGKVVISWDIFSYPSGDELKQYPDLIYYCKDINELPDVITSMLKAGKRFKSVSECFVEENAI